MPKDENAGGGLGEFVRGVGEHISADICLTLIGGVCLRVGLSKTDKLDDWSDWPIWLALAGLLTLLTFGANSIRLGLSRWRRRAAVRRASGDKITLLIARLENDRDNRIRETIRELLKHELGQAVEIVFWPESLGLADGHDTDAEAMAERTAQRWLVNKSCDVLLWGRVKSDELVSLRTTVAKGETSSAATHRLTTEFTRLAALRADRSSVRPLPGGSPHSLPQRSPIAAAISFQP